jgi:hypothetical protein
MLGVYRGGSKYCIEQRAAYICRKQNQGSKEKEIGGDQALEDIREPVKLDSPSRQDDKARRRAFCI